MHMQRRGGHVKTKEAEMGRIHPQAKEHRGSPAIARSYDEARKNYSLEPWRGECGSSATLISGFRTWVSRPWREPISAVLSHPVWYFIVTAVGD